MTHDDPARTAESETGRLAQRLENRDYRQALVATQLRAFLADQIRAMRGDLTQSEFGRLIGKPQSVVSRLENEDSQGLSLQTLIDIAERLDVAVVARFVDFDTFTKVVEDKSDAALVPASFAGPPQRAQRRSVSTPTRASIAAAASRQTSSR